ncbi:MAG TPA: hypothetical protein VLG09_03870 [Candidatus Saccharimonadales bacterium]|nr:hypothetical protein [Candidatus Saccharimonadales bacterium]
MTHINLNIETEEQLRMISQMITELVAIDLGTSLYKITDNEAIVGVSTSQYLLRLYNPDVEKTERRFDPADFRCVREEATHILEEAGIDCTAINKLAYEMQDRLEKEPIH